jgi:sulfoxide reductase catalytic subunit YedY
MPRRETFSLPEREATPKDIYLRRREFMAAGIGLIAGCAPASQASATTRLNFRPGFSTPEEQTKRDDATTYNNYYEFGTDKSQPAENAGRLTTRPWSVRLDGLCNKPARFDIDDIMRRFSLEQRVYRLRCVEGWSMVIPWVGFPLKDLLALAEPQGSARYVAFETLNRPSEMIGQRDQVLDWPYREGLRMDEAMHPLTLLAVGMYGETLPNQNGAPIRLAVPWKYGFKSIKSIVRISFVEREPPTAWNVANAGEYGFYSNVNPNVDHPRWSQANERRIGEFRRRPTLMFNGYGQWVSDLYRGMDLRRYF